MRGIVIHSLMARGVSFDEAFHTAEEVRARVRRAGRHTEGRRSPKILREILGDEPFREDRRRPAARRHHGHRWRGKAEPFSKGRLSQSILAAALDPNDAFDVAREIERELVLNGTLREIQRHDLRQH